jgi:hypothetical protein
MPVIVANPRLDGKSDYYDDRDLISVSLGIAGVGSRELGRLLWQATRLKHLSRRAYAEQP